MRKIHIVTRERGKTVIIKLPRVAASDQSATHLKVHPGKQIRYNDTLIRYNYTLIIGLGKVKCKYQSLKFLTMSFANSSELSNILRYSFDGFHLRKKQLKISLVLPNAMHKTQRNMYNISLFEKLLVATPNLQCIYTCSPRNSLSTKSVNCTSPFFVAT